MEKYTVSHQLAFLLHQESSKIEIFFQTQGSHFFSNLVSWVNHGCGSPLPAYHDSVSQIIITYCSSKHCISLVSTLTRVAYRVETFHGFQSSLSRYSCSNYSPSACLDFWNLFEIFKNGILSLSPQGYGADSRISTVRQPGVLQC